jgi:tetratricopeptide (TPR) repeat protein
MHQGKLEQAESDLQHALEIAPADAEAANNLGTVRIRLKDYNGAVESLTRAVELNPSLIKAHANLAQAYQRSGHAIEAQHESERVASLTAQLRTRGRAMIDVQSAQEQFKAGKAADAVSTLKKAIDASPDFSDAYFELGRIIRDSGGDPNSAITAFRRVLNLDPERAEAHYEIGLALERLGRKIDALSEYRIAVEMAPCNVDARRALGQAGMSVGQWSLAADQFRAVFAFQPRDMEAKRQYELAAAKQRAAP